MDLKIENNTSQPLEEIQALIKEFYPHAKKQLGFNKPVSINFLSDPANSANPLGKTAHYDPNNYSIGLYVDKRHPKDVLRSFSHELVHHRQNCQGKFDNAVAVEGYAQQDDHLREMEKEAYLEGNMLLRDWEDSKKQETKERKPMNEQKLRELTRKIIEELNTKGVAVTSNVNEEEVVEEEIVEEEVELDEGDSYAKRDDKMEEVAVEETNQKPTPIHESVAKKKGEVLFDRLMNKWCK